VQRRAGPARLICVDAELAKTTVTASPGPARIDSAAAVSELFRVHHLELVRLAALMTGDLATAEDVVQDVFEAIARAGRASPGHGGGCAMSELEERLRQELQNMAQRLAPADPRPCASHPRGTRPAGPAGWLR
jgi:hypothetical protein